MSIILNENIPQLAHSNWESWHAGIIIECGLDFGDAGDVISMGKEREYFGS